jgi:hypothetical protein
MEKWEFRAETKEAAIEMLLAQQRFWPHSKLPAEEVQKAIGAINDLDLSLPPPREVKQDYISDGWRWMIKVSFEHVEMDFASYPESAHKSFRHELLIHREPLIYGLQRRDAG